MNVFTVTFDQFNESLLNKNINYIFKKKVCDCFGIILEDISSDFKEKLTLNWTIYPC